MVRCQLWEEIDEKAGAIRWGWSLTNEYGEEVASCEQAVPNRHMARMEMLAALEDWNDIL
jgi:hypothetical protein